MRLMLWLLAINWKGNVFDNNCYYGIGFRLKGKRTGLQDEFCSQLLAKEHASGIIS